MTEMTVQQAIELGKQHHQAGRLREAEAVYRQVLANQPNQPDALQLLGVIAFHTGQLDLAIDLIRRAIAVQPIAPFYSNLGMALAAKGNIDGAIAAYRQAIALNPSLSDAHYNLGNILRTLGRLDEAIASYRRSIQVQPRNATAHLNLANTLREQQRLDEAVAEYTQAIEITPESAAAHYNLGLTLLLQGQFERGWREYEWRTRDPQIGVPLEQLPSPRWDGGELAGKRILLQTEQGFGDAIQFARLIPQIAARGGTVILRCRPELIRLFKTLAGVGRVISNDDPLPEFDAHYPLLSLPLTLGITATNVPAPVPYLRADPELSSRWRTRLSQPTKVGLVWAGAPGHKNDRNRSIAFEKLSPIVELPGIQFISLQKFIRASREGIVDWTDELHDFADTAALIDNLDLVITVDTAVAHLAGALDKRVWVLLPFVPDWRWMLGRSDSPWYPTMKLFRQQKIGDWDAPIRQIVQELRCLK